MTIAGPVLLIGSAILSWLLAADARAPARRNLRFGATLFAAGGVAGLAAGLLPPDFGAMGDAAMLLIAPLGAVALGLAASSTRWIAVPALLFACLAGLLSAATGAVLPALGALGVAAALLLAGACARDHWRGMLRVALAAFCVGGAGLCLAQEASGAAALFLAAGLLGAAIGLRALKSPVEQARGRNVGVPIGLD